jgi:hypothetical protein
VVGLGSSPHPQPTTLTCSRIAGPGSRVPLSHFGHQFFAANPRFFAFPLSPLLRDACLIESRSFHFKNCCSNLYYFVLVFTFWSNSNRLAMPRQTKRPREVIDLTGVDENTRPAKSPRLPSASDGLQPAAPGLGQPSSSATSVPNATQRHPENDEPEPSTQDLTQSDDELYGFFGMFWFTLPTFRHGKSDTRQTAKLWV